MVIQEPLEQRSHIISKLLQIETAEHIIMFGSFRL